MKNAGPFPPKNPILSGFYPDPSICRVGLDYYLVTSSFEYFPGVPIFHSRDLIHFRQVGHVLTRPSQLELGSARSSGGIYAATIRYHNGCFFVITTLIGRGNFYVTARHPEGPWSNPIWIDTEGIDPSLLFQGDRVIYTRTGKGRDGDHPQIHQGYLALRQARRPRTRAVWSGTGGVWTEAPHLVRYRGYYYLFCAEGGTGYGHSVVVARSRDPFGPFEACPHNPVLSHRDRPRARVQATGHCDLVELPDGRWFAVLLGIRVTVPRHHHLGRETFLVPVTWSADGWPRFGRGGRVPERMSAPPLPLLPGPTSSRRDDFAQAKLAHHFVFVRNPNPRDWSLTARPGFLRLLGSAGSPSQAQPLSAVLTRQCHFSIRARTLLEFAPRGPNEEAGLLVRADEANHYLLRVRGQHSEMVVELLACRRGSLELVGARRLRGERFALEMTSTKRHYRFFAGSSRRVDELGVLPCLPLSAEVVTKPGHMCFTGVMIGMYATGRGRRSLAPADFDWFELEAI